MTPQSAGKIATAKLQAETRARYLSVQHILSDAEAARVLGLTDGTVRIYRVRHPDVRPDGFRIGLTRNQAADAARQAVQREVDAKPPVAAPDATSRCSRPLARSYAVPVALQIGGNGALMAKTVSLPKEPFEVPTP